MLGVSKKRIPYSEIDRVLEVGTQACRSDEMTEEERDELKEEILEEILETRYDMEGLGILILRIILLVGSITGFLMGNEMVGRGCCTGLIMSFVFL